VFPEGPLFQTVAPYAQPINQAKRNARGPPPHFIPGTNAIESLNYPLRKIIKNRGHCPNDQAAVKLLWLAICNIEDKRARERVRQRDRAAPRQYKKSNRLVEGAIVTGWKHALAALVLNYPDRLEPYIY
jgi:putative transposase